MKNESKLIDIMHLLLEVEVLECAGNVHTIALNLFADFDLFQGVLRLPLGDRPIYSQCVP